MQGPNRICQAHFSAPLAEHWHPETTTTAGMAVDGIHPSSEGYAVWADGLGRCILAANDRHPADEQKDDEQKDDEQG